MSKKKDGSTMSTSNSRKKIKNVSLERTNARIGYLFIAPWIIGAVVFLIYPLVSSFWYALNNIRITPLGKNFRFVGTGNFTQILLADADFPTMLVDYIGMIIVSIPIILVFSLIISILLNEKIIGKAIFRTLFFLPVIIVSGPVMGMLTSDGATNITSIDVQVITNTLAAFLPRGIYEPIAKVFANMVMILWYSGVPILIYIAGLQKIDPAIYEASKIDGASAWQNFWKITLPSIQPMILLNAIYTIVFMSSNEQNNIINLIRNNMFSGTQERGYGYASAMAWIYAVVVFFLVLLFVVIFMTKKDKYERQAAKNDRQYKKELRNKSRIEKRNARARQKRLRSEGEKV